MSDSTNLQMVKYATEALYSAVPLQESDFGIIIHPFIETRFCNIKGDDGTWDIKDILADPDVKKSYEEQLFERIRKSDLLHVYMQVRDPWKLTWLKFTKEFLSDKDFADYLADAWVTEENPNADANVSRQELISWFKHADKKALMQEDDYEYYSSLPEKLTIYRGVAIGRQPYGLSWTDDREKAEWFMHRFEGWAKNGQKGYLLKAKANKSEMLAYLNTRGEKEIVTDVFSLKRRNAIKRCNNVDSL